MHWIIENDKNNAALVEMLKRMGSSYAVRSELGKDTNAESAGEGPERVFVFDSSRYEHGDPRKEGYGRPGFFDLRPCFLEEPWRPFLLNSRDDAKFVRYIDIPDQVPDDERRYFIRPVEAGNDMFRLVLMGGELLQRVSAVMSFIREFSSDGAEDDSGLLLAASSTIQKEWRVWVIAGSVVTWSLYKMAGEMVARPEIDQDALEFAKAMAAVNPGYSDAYAIDVCRTEEGLRIVETKCINFAGYFDADLHQLVEAVERLYA